MLTAIAIRRIKFNTFPSCIILKIRNKVMTDAIRAPRLLFFKINEKVKNMLKNRSMKNSGRIPGV